MLLSLRAYAKHRKANNLHGVTLAAVQKAIASGRIKTARGGKIDPARADIEWGQRTDPSQQRDLPADRERRVQQGEAPETHPPGPLAGESAEPEMDPGDYQKNRAANEYWDAYNRRLKALRDEKRYVDLEAVKRTAAGLIATAKSRLRGVGAKVAPEVATISEPAMCQSLVDAEIDEALAELSRWEPTAA